MKQVLVLGAGGFIGGHLCKKLKEQGCFVRGVDIKNHSYFTNDEMCHEFFIGDLRDKNFTSRIMWAPNQTSQQDGSFDEVYQLAADMGGAGYINTGENDALVMNNSTMINLNVLDESVKKGIKKIFFSSSACVYPEFNQEDEYEPNCEEYTVYPAQPDSNYGWEKLYGERLYKAYEKNYGVNVRIGRFHNVYGPFGTYDGGREKVPAALCRKVAKAEDTIEIWGDGFQTRSFLYVDDCIDAMLKLMESDFNEPINIGSEDMISIVNLAYTIIFISGKEIQIKNVPGPQGVRGRNSHNDLIKSVLNWHPKVSLDDGISKTYNWIEKEIKK
jgi:nucleoside-diphosphate-sugar epimerase